MNELWGNKEEGAHETKESIEAWTRDVPLAGPALEGNGNAGTKVGAPDYLEPYESNQIRPQDRQLSTSNPQSRADRQRAVKRNNGRAAGILLESESNNQAKIPGALIDKSEWLTTKEAAIQLRKFLPSGEPSANAVHKLVANGSLRRRKFAGRLFFRKKEIDFLIESSVV